MTHISTTATHEPKKRLGSFIPLFERLIDEDLEKKTEFPVHKFHSPDSIRDSIERELKHILGTHSKFRKENYEILAKNPWNYGLSGMYGIPEFSSFEGNNPNNWPAYASYIQKAIESYEPRLKNVSVLITAVNRNEQFLDIIITAEIISTEYQEEATFPLRLRFFKQFIV